jgi:hypothetical protein
MLRNEFSHPEIEAGLARNRFEILHGRDDLLALATYVDLLVVYHQTEPKVEWFPGLDHESLLQCNNASLQVSCDLTEFSLVDYTERRSAEFARHPNPANIVSVN